MQNAKSKIQSLADPNEPELYRRTRRFGVRVVKLYCAMSKQTEMQVIGTQMLRSGTSVGAQHREGKRARSDAEFVSKLNSALQELEETMYWLEVLVEAELLPIERLRNLYQEANEICGILIAAITTTKKRMRKTAQHQ